MLNQQLSHEVIKVDLSQASEIQPAGMFHLTIQSIPSKNERWHFEQGLRITGSSNVAVNKTFRLKKKINKKIRSVAMLAQILMRTSVVKHWNSNGIKA